MPLFFKADPSTTTLLFWGSSATTLRILSLMSAGPKSSSRYLSRKQGSRLAKVSSKCSLFLWMSKYYLSSDKTGVAVTVWPRASSQVMLCIVIKSTMPEKPSASPIGNYTTKVVTSNLECIDSRVYSRLAPCRSILFMKITRGTSNLFAYFHTIWV